MAKAKESHHFAPEFLGASQAMRSRDHYLSLFSIERHHKFVGESSVYYLYSDSALQNIRSYDQNAKVIAILRNPVEAIYSHHSQLVFNGNQTVIDFEEALFKGDEASIDKNNNMTNDKIFNYRDIFLYYKQIVRLYKIVPSENIKILIYDDFREETEKTYQECLRFIGASSDHVPSFRVINSNKQVRSRLVRTWLQDPPPWLSAPFKRTLPLSKRNAIKMTVKNLNTRYLPRKEMSEDTRRELQSFYREDVEKLGDLLGRDLTQWAG